LYVEYTCKYNESTTKLPKDDQKEKEKKNPEHHVKEQLMANCLAEWLETQIADEIP